VHQTAFTADLAAELTARGVPHTLAAVEAFVADCWPHIEADPSTGKWANQFAVSQQTAAAPPTEMGKLGTGQRIDHDLWQQFEDDRLDRMLAVLNRDQASRPTSQ